MALYAPVQVQEVYAGELQNGTIKFVTLNEAFNNVTRTVAGVRFQIMWDAVTGACGGVCGCMCVCVCVCVCAWACVCVSVCVCVCVSLWLPGRLVPGCLVVGVRCA